MQREDLLLVRELARTVKETGSAVAFLGAGASVSADIPPASKIIELLLSQHHVRAKTYAGAMRSAFRGPHGAEQRRAFMESLCAARLPSTGHRVVAHLADRGHLGVVITTNFDHLTEMALATICNKPVILYLWDDDLDELPSAQRSALIFKLHGDYLFKDLASLDSEMRQRLSNKMRRIVSECLRDVPLIVVGYSGEDRSIMSFLTSAARAPDLLTRGVWWVSPSA